MRLLKKLLLKVVMMIIMVGLMGAMMRVAKPYIMKSAGMPEAAAGAETLAAAQFTSEESDLMATMLKSALRFFSGSAKREELAGELSDKLYGGRPGAANMAELGIELEGPGTKPGAPASVTPPPAPQLGDPSLPNGTLIVAAQPGALLPFNAGAPQAAASPAVSSSPPAAAPAKPKTNSARDALLGRIWAKATANPELSLVPVVLVGMSLVHFVRRRRSPEDDFVLPDLSKVLAAESEAYEMQHSVDSFGAEEFELLVALIFQRQGYRVTMPAGLSGGRGGDFILQRKSERLLVQCKRLRQDDSVSVDRVRELYEAALAAGVTRGMYVASGSFSWDARNFAKVKGVTVINARTLDALITEAFAKSDDELLQISQWAPKLMSKVKLTPPLCPACDAPMDELSSSTGSAWVCSQRPDCRGRRPARKSYTQAEPAAAVQMRDAAPAAPQTDVIRGAPTTPRHPPQIARNSPAEARDIGPQPLASKGGRARTISPSRR
jgi:hypothetical protein